MTATALRPLPEPGHAWSPTTRTLTEATTRLGLNPDTLWVPLTGGATTAVYRLPAYGLVVRFSSPDVTARTAAAQVRWFATLAHHGVPVATPARREVLALAAGPVTVWQDLGAPVGLPDYEQVGTALRALHDTGTRVLADDPDLHPVDDFTALAAHLDAGLVEGCLTVAEHAAIRPWVDRVAALHETLPASERVLVHDDVWAKNMLQTPTGTVLIDPDNLGWGSRDHDLAFLVRAHESGLLTHTQVAAFEDGYGQPVPDSNTAWAHAYVHRLRWVRNMLTRRRIVAADAEAFARELPHWSLPRGPRDAAAAAFGA